MQHLFTLVLRFDDSLLVPAHQLATHWLTDGEAAAAKASPKDLEGMKSNQICAFLDKLLQGAPLLVMHLMAMNDVSNAGGLEGVIRES